MNNRYATLLFILLTTFTANAQWSTNNLPSGGRSFLAAATSGNYALFAGGIGMISIPPGVSDKFQLSTNTWSGGTLSTGRVKLAGAGNGKYAVFGGGANDWIFAVYDAVDIYNSTTNTWNTSQTLSAARYSLTGAAAGSKILMAGGMDNNGTYFTTVDLFDTLNGAWTTAALSTGRANLASASTTTHAFFAGGENGNGYSDVVDIYEAATGTWTTAQLSIARANLGGTACGNKIYFAGGLTGSTVSKRVDIYDITTNTWSIDSLSIARQNVMVAAVGKYVLFAGGSDALGMTVYNNVDILDTLTGTWTTATLTTARTYGAATSIGNKAIFAGGAGSNGFAVATAETYTVTNTGLFIPQEAEGLLVYPNPSNGTFHLNTSTLKGDITCSMFNLQGQLVYSKQFTAGDQNITIGLSEINAGVYILKIEDSQKIRVEKIQVD
ncbi:MAG: T9SS type A sorting domain-containing protein [Bacteroidia bacterium]|nr:T9SS type A sorting domain-containing protein [Bacteroidia bacterium]